MAYSPSLAEFVYKACVSAVEKCRSGAEDETRVLEVADRVAAFRSAGYVTDAQISALSEALGVDVEVPDSPDTYEDEFRAVRESVELHDEAIAELGEVVSGIVGGGE